MEVVREKQNTMELKSLYGYKPGTLWLIVLHLDLKEINI